jgi:hypothetical protein
MKCDMLQLKPKVHSVYILTMIGKVVYLIVLDIVERAIIHCNVRSVLEDWHSETVQSRN